MHVEQDTACPMLRKLQGKLVADKLLFIVTVSTPAAVMEPLIWIDGALDETLPP
jgi:hypothetical protein